jgi:thiol-disulfide isomerase/thioredoxin
MPKTAQQGNAARQLIRRARGASGFRSRSATEESGEVLKRMVTNKQGKLRFVKLRRMLMQSRNPCGILKRIPFMHKFLLCAVLFSLAPLLHADDSSKPLDLKYTAVDGKAIDLSQMRGKVVLVDFWATWCPPCREEVPNVVAAYKKYHDKGFEILGVSLDQNKDAMLGFTKAHDMAWPQYFDGKGWDNDVSGHFGIQEIPTMWLVGKDGKVITTSARDDLDSQIAKALAAQ